MNESTEFRHWRLETDSDNVVWLSIDREGESVNSLSREVLTELEKIVDFLHADPPAGLVLKSGKEGSFIVGADVREFESVSDPEEAADNIREVHRLFNRFEALPFSKVAIIDGYCLGGGLELALCCDYRIAANNERTRLGFPEVQLGIYPGFGGSARSTQLLGGLKALPLMLTGRNLRPGAARGLGLVDQLVGPHGELRWAARKAIAKGRKAKGPGVAAKLSNAGPARRLLANKMRKETAKKANPKHYPAPFELIDAWEASGDDASELMEEEAKRVGRLITGDTSKNLRRVFHLMEKLKSSAKQSTFKARRVHVIGAGVMGGDIAAWCAFKGLEVTLQDREMQYIEPAMKRAKSFFKKALKHPTKVAAAMARLIPDVDGAGVKSADVIIEAIYENLEAKQALFKTLEASAEATAILATNTSAIPLAEIASVLKKPDRLIGLHFFNPATKMPLVEVIHDQKTKQNWLDDGASFCGQIGKFPIAVASSPGFLVNRVLGPYMAKAMTLYRQGTPKEALDAAARGFGMPMGPVELADTVGLDVALGVTETLGGDNADEQKAFLKKYVDAGKLGKKSGAGFYTWEKGKPVKDDDAITDQNLENLAHQLLQPYFDECQAALAEGIVADADVLDAGMIFGTGFAPFRGGPLNYLNHQNPRAQSSPVQTEEE